MTTAEYGLSKRLKKMLKRLGVVIPSTILTLLMAVGFSTPVFAYVDTTEVAEEPVQVIEEAEPTEEGFKEFFEKEVPGNPLKAEYLVPIFIGELLEHGKMSVRVLKTNDTWYGMTYHEDVAAVKGSFKEMLENGVYKADLFSDL